VKGDLPERTFEFARRVVKRLPDARSKPRRQSYTCPSASSLIEQSVKSRFSLFTLHSSHVYDAFSYATLTILVWGVNALQRGLWHDDVQALGEAFQRSSHSFSALFAPDASPLRRLTVAADGWKVG
jgi:hypothetical protein